MRCTLGKEEKLKSRKQIEQLFVEGLSVKEFPIRMKYLKVKEENKFPIKIAFSVPKRNFKLAVKRNRIKRLLRETYRLNKYILLNEIDAQYVVMFIYTDRTEWKYADLEQKMISLLRKFVKNQEHLLVRNTTREWVKREISPIIEDFAQRAEFPKLIVNGLAQIGAFGSYIPTKYGGAGLDQISYGLIMQEIERGDSSIRSVASVQSSLVMYPIFKYGSETQKQKYLPKLASGEFIGCFGLTEPNHGSNPNGMETKFKDMGNHYLLNGAKMWITNAPIADIAIVWAKNEEGRIHGLIVERGMEGFTTPETHNKWSLRASITGELIFDNVKIPKENILPEKSGLGAPLGCLDSARYGISWGVIGVAMDCYETALRYSKERTQFGKPIASFQLQQKKLAEMITEITKAQLLAWRLGVLRNEGRATPAQISMAKRNNVAMALHIARESRQILGAMGISGHYSIMRHMMNLESVITYEGTHDIHLLITGLDITGENAFK